ncbi:S8 family serine peptidase [Microbacterium marinilacus]|uniref:Peptidase S8/S53 domain-containing protein n=1 Tax=Microbacterium marinilacus TaxID=415209 RepID=A0ABP7BJJ6_9MICO|nr:S8 family serine peptidase [Microbacterium marinilacus]MBY0689502.1 S8 family serine peptidase [Microbacterium marinilacus]
MSTTGSGRRGVRTLLALAMAASLVAMPAAAVGATEVGSDDDELWYFEDTGIPELQQTATGEGVTIALLDSGVNPDAPTLRGADIVGSEFSCPDGEGTVNGLHDDVSAEHGTYLASILVGNGEQVGDQPGVPGIAPDAALISYDVVTEDPTGIGTDEEYTCEDSTELLRDTILDAIDKDVDMIVTATGFSLRGEAATALIQAIDAGIVVVAANSNVSELSFESTSNSVHVEQFNGVVSVENATQSGERADPVTGPWVTILAPGTGYINYGRGDGTWDERKYSAAANSPASTYVGGVLALAKSAYPDATGDQLIQALVRGADGGNPDLVRTDENGYGFISPRTMIATDPATLPDENPLLRDAPQTWPLLEDFEDGVFTDDTWDYPLEGDAASADGTTAPSADDPGSAEGGDGSPLGPVLIVAVVLGGIVVVGGIVLAAVLVARSRRRS